LVHHRCSAVTERCYDKRTLDEIVERMVLPLEWCGGDAALGRPADANSETGVLAAEALLEEMDRSDRLDEQLRSALSYLTAEQRLRWQNERGNDTVLVAAD
jgi:hypothetical protein